MKKNLSYLPSLSKRGAGGEFFNKSANFATCIVRSELLLARYLPSLLRSIERIKFECGLMVLTSFPLCGFQIFIVVSQLLLTRYLPSGV